MKLLCTISQDSVKTVVVNVGTEYCTLLRISGLQRQLRDPEEAELWRSRGNGLLQVTQQWYPGMYLGELNL